LSKPFLFQRRNSVETPPHPVPLPFGERVRVRGKGSILVLAMWILVFFSVLCAALYAAVSSQIRLAERIEDKIICKYMAKAAVLYAQRERKIKEAGTVTTYDTLYELREKEERELGAGGISYILEDEEGRINVNTAPVEIIAALPGLNLELAEKINSSKLRPFHFKEEILLVEDITEEIFDQCKYLITVYGSGKVNINTASGEALKALGMDEQLVNTILDFRKGKDYNEATGDDGVFTTTDEIINKLRAFKTLFEAQEALLISLVSKGLLGVESKNFSMQIEAKITGKPAGRYVVVMDKDKIKQWQEF